MRMHVLVAPFLTLIILKFLQENNFSFLNVNLRKFLNLNPLNNRCNMAKWSTYRSRITTSVRTTNRMNTLLNESQKKKPILKQNADNKEITTTNEENEVQEEQKPKIKIEFFRTNFTMEYVHKIIGQIIEERLSWDRFNRVYDPWKSAQLAENLAIEIRDRVKTLNYRRYRIVCLLSVVEKKNQGVDYKMKFLMDEKMDNFTTYIHERATYNIVATVFLVFKE